MPQPHLRRLLLVFTSITVAIIVVPIAVFSLWLDPGHKHDTSTDLVTPTMHAQHIRVFEVSPTESQVEFATVVRGITIQGVFPVDGGTITLEPVGEELRVHVYLEINVDEVEIADIARPFIRRSMETGNYPVAFYVALSQELVPVTEEVITFALEGELDVHNMPHDHVMNVEAQLIGRDMWAVATSELDLAAHDVEFPAIFGSSAIELTARLFMHEIEAPAFSLVPETANGAS